MIILNPDFLNTEGALYTKLLDQAQLALEYIPGIQRPQLEITQ